MPRIRSYRLSALSSAVLAALSAPGAVHANTIVANGTTCNVFQAITAANTDAAVGGCGAGSGKDVIQVSASEVLGFSSLPPIVTDIDFVGTGATTPTLNNANEGRGFIIGAEVSGNPVAPKVSFGNLVLANFSTSGASGSEGGGGGAGLGATIFIYAGNVRIDHVAFTNNVIAGGNGSDSTGVQRGAGGGGGLASSGTGGFGGNESAGLPGGGTSFGGGGGGGGDKFTTETGGSNGGAGGFTTGGAGGLFGSTPPGNGGFFGGGGGGAGAPVDNGPGQDGGDGGFGGGGGGGGGSNGFDTDVGGQGGAGGFGAGGGGGGNSIGHGGGAGLGGFGGGGGGGGQGEFGGSGGGAGFGGRNGTSAHGGAGAALGGAIFMRTGQLNLRDSSFTGSTVTRGTSTAGSGTAKGGAIFVLNSLAPPNGNDQGYPAALPTVTGCGVSFAGSVALDALATDVDNADVFGTSRAALTTPAVCDLLFKDGFE